MRASTILPATLAATAGLGALANARAIPPPERAAKRAIAAQARPSGGCDVLLLKSPVLMCCDKPIALLHCTEDLGAWI